MSIVNAKTKFKVQSSNIASVASFISTLDDANIVLTPNNCNDLNYISTNNLTYKYNTSTSEKSIHFDISENGELLRPISFTDQNINLNHVLYASGDIAPSIDGEFSLGTSNFKWKDLYLSGNTISIASVMISSEPDGGIKLMSENSNVGLESVNIKILADVNDNVLLTSNYSRLISDDSGVKLNYYDSNDNLIKSLPLGVANTSIFVEGSNLYYTAERWENWFIQRNYMDLIADGSSNRFILNHEYDGNLNITKQYHICL